MIPASRRMTPATVSGAPQDLPMQVVKGVQDWIVLHNPLAVKMKTWKLWIYYQVAFFQDQISSTRFPHSDLCWGDTSAPQAHVHLLESWAKHAINHRLTTHDLWCWSVSGAQSIFGCPGRLSTVTWRQRVWVQETVYTQRPSLQMISNARFQGRNESKRTLSLHSPIVELLCKSQWN